jgi:hypothetical protein
MHMPKIAILALSLAALGLIAAPAHAYTEDKVARVDRLLNDDGDAAVPDHGPGVSDPNAKALNCNPAYKQNLTPGPVAAPAFEVSQSDDLLALEPEPEVPLNGGINPD